MSAIQTAKRQEDLEILHIYGGAKLIALKNGYAMVLEDNPDLAVGVKLKDIIETLKTEITRKAIPHSDIVEVIYSDKLCDQAEARFRRFAKASFEKAIFSRYKEANCLKKAVLPAAFTDFIDKLDEES